jgi:hypothetical protein
MPLRVDRVEHCVVNAGKVSHARFGTVSELSAFWHSLARYCALRYGLVRASA